MEVVNDTGTAALATPRYLHRTFRTPPVPGINAPAVGDCAIKSTKAA